MGEFLYPQRQFAIGEPCAQLRVGGDALRRAQHFAIGVEQDRVTAFQRGQRADRVQGASGLLQGEAVAFQPAFDRLTQTLGRFGEAAPQQLQALLWMLREQACVDALEPRLTLLLLFAQAAQQTSLQMDQPFAIARQAGLRSLRL